jgi:hypothetical protein
MDGATGMTCLMLAASRNLVEIMRLVRAAVGIDSICMRVGQRV